MEVASEESRRAPAGARAPRTGDGEGRAAPRSRPVGCWPWACSSWSSASCCGSRPAPTSGSTRHCRSTSPGSRSPTCETVLRHDGAPPLYYALLHFWIDVFGLGNLAVRSLSGCSPSRRCRWRGSPADGSGARGHRAGTRRLVAHAPRRRARRARVRVLAVHDPVRDRSPHVLARDVPGDGRVPRVAARARAAVTRTSRTGRGARRGDAVHALLDDLPARGRGHRHDVVRVPRAAHRSCATPPVA